MNAPLGLLPLSMYRVTGRRKVPVTPTNETRYRCFRDALPVRIGNAMDWRTLHGSQSGADPGPSNPAGCHTAYARGESAPEPITNDYAALSGGW
jgi:hypothetical protein